MNGLATRNRFLPYLLAFFGSLCIMILELVASRLVARHVGASLNVWTSVIGIMLGGICLGNVLGGRLADRSEPTRVIGPLYALGAALTLGCLWLNALGGYLPEAAPGWLRTVALVSIDFLVPGTVLGMIGPVVAKIAVEQARKAGSAIGDVYFLGAVGSIAGTFLAGYFLMYYAPTTTIVTLVAAGLALMATFLLGDAIGVALGLLTTVLLGLGSIAPLTASLPLRGLDVGGIAINPIALAGHASALALAALGLVRLMQARLPEEEPAEDKILGEPPPKVRLGDLAALAFLISLAFMSFEMVAGRLVSRHLGSSIYGWTSVIGVLLGGLSLGNFLGGKAADVVKSEKEASWLFLIASALLLSVLVLESPPRFFVSNPIGYLFQGQPGEPLVKGAGSVLSTAISMNGVPWGLRLFIVITLAFFLPSVALGTVSPVMAKLAIDRVERTKRTGGAIGMVYAWGMVGSILGTFLTGFVLIDVLGTKGVLVVLATVLALAATVIGTTWHALWAGIPLGLCIMTFLPIPMLRNTTERWGIREPVGDPGTDKDDAVAWLDESNYYYIKVENSLDSEGKKRTLVLDNLIHGYFIIDHPERLDYDYEHIYALVADRVARAKAKARSEENPKLPRPSALKTMFLGGGAYTFQRYILNKYPSCDVRLMSSAKDVGGLPTEGKNLIVLANVEERLRFRTFDLNGNLIFDSDEGTILEVRQGRLKEQTLQVEALKKQIQDLEGEETGLREEIVRLEVLKKQLQDLASLETRRPEEVRQIDALKKQLRGLDGAEARLKELIRQTESLKRQLQGREREEAHLKEQIRQLGGLKKQLQDLWPPHELTEVERDKIAAAVKFIVDERNYPGSIAEVAEIDPAVKEANHQALDLPRDTAIVTHLGDARQFVERNQDRKKFDIIFGDAFNDFSVPWHLTTREFNDKLARMMEPDGVYMINIIDVYESDARADSRGEAAAQKKHGKPSDDDMEAEKKKERATALGLGGFLGSWVETARLTFPHIYVFGTDNDPGSGLRETFVVVASKAPLDLDILGGREDDPKFFNKDTLVEPRPYSKLHMDELKVRSRGIILTDDFAPVENLLAPVAATRGDD